MPTITLALYLWRRIREVGIESVMGVPGDFNLNFLDYIYEVPGLKFVGNSNELNAAYAADGYARVKGVPGCIVTTHGVGELSAMNGIAGAASEYVPLIHIVGQTPREMQEKNVMVHHSLGFDPDHQAFNKASASIRFTAAELRDSSTAPSEIDCYLNSLPVYIFMPIDMTYDQVDEGLLNTKIDLSFPAETQQLDAAVAGIVDAIKASKSPCLLVDHLVNSFHCRSEAQELARVLQLPTFTTHMGKSVIDEDAPYFVGSYNGLISLEGVTEAVESSDLILILGFFPTDTNCGGMSRNLAMDKRIEVQQDHVVIKGRKFSGIHMHRTLQKLIELLKNVTIPKVEMPSVAHQLPTPVDFDAKEVRQSYLWQKLNQFIKPGDVLLADIGTAAFGFHDYFLPPKTQYICGTYWSTIGYATPAGLGSAMALQELHNAGSRTQEGRTVIVTGDGSLQLVIQEIGTMVRLGLKPIIIILNNSGYTIERAIHGAQQAYNDINPHDYSHLLPLYFHPQPTKAYRSARTRSELEDALSTASLNSPEHVEIIEIYLDKLDIPWRLAGVLKAAGRGADLEKAGFSNVEQATKILQKKPAHAKV